MFTVIFSVCSFFFCHQTKKTSKDIPFRSKF